MSSVSVVIPTFNRSLFLIEAIRSLNNQGISDLEILVCDDGSTEDIVKAVGEIRGVRVLVLPHRGAPAARNAGIQAATGTFIKFMDSDDLLEPDTLHHQVEALKASGADLCCSPCRTLTCRGDNAEYSDPSPLPSISEDPDVWLKLWLRGVGTGIHAFLFRRELVNRVGLWDESLLLRQDTDYVLRSFLARAKLTSESRGCAVYRRHSGDVISSLGITPEGLASWLSVINKVRSTLEVEHRSELFSSDLSFSYFLIARRAYCIDRTLAMRAYQLSCQLAPNGVVQGGVLYRGVHKVFGFRIAQTIESIVAKMRRVRLPYGAE